MAYIDCERKLFPKKAQKQKIKGEIHMLSVLFVQKGDKSFPQLSKRLNSDPSSRFFIGEAREKMGNL